MGPVLQHQAVPDNARTRGAEQSQLEGTAARTVQQRGRWRCIWGAELTVITSGEPVILNRPPSQWADCLWSSLEMWMGSWGERTLLSAAEGSEWRQHYLFPRFPLLDHLNPLFNYKTRTQQYAFGFRVKPWICKAQWERTEGNNKVLQEVLRWPSCFSKHHETWTEAFSRNLWNLTRLMQQCVSVPSTKFSRRKWKCEVPSLCASGQTWCLQTNSEILVLNPPWSTIVKEPLRILKIKPKLQPFPPVCLSSPLDATKASHSLSFYFVHWKLSIYPRVPPSFHSSAVGQCNFF